MDRANLAASRFPDHESSRLQGQEEYSAASRPTSEAAGRRGLEETVSAALGAMTEHEMTGGASAGRRLLATLGTAAGNGVVTVEDSFDADIDTVWSAITDPPRLAFWWGEVEGDLRPGGEYRERVYASGWEGPGRVGPCDAPRRQKVMHREPDQPAEQSIEITLTANGGTTALVSEERGMPVAYLAGYGAGIQVDAEDLGGYLAWRQRCDADARMGELFPAYEPLAANVSQVE